MCKNKTIDRSWEARVSSMPRIPRGNKGYVESLRIILNEVKNGKRPNDVIEIPGSNSQRTLKQDCVGLRPSGIVKLSENNSEWKLTEISRKWLSNKNNDYLAIFMNGQIKFFSEVLKFCINPQTSRNIYNLAIQKYKLPWKQKGQIFERTSWLIDFGYLEYIDFNSTFKTTSAGLSFLDLVTPYDYKEIEIQSSLHNHVTINIDKLDPSILSLVPKSEEQLKKRIHTLGYTPGSTEDILNVITGYLELAVDGRILISNIIEYSQKTYGIKKSSIRGFLSQLVHSELVERISSEEYEVTKYGQMILDDNNIIDLIIYFHAKYLFFFEILSEVRKKPLDTKEIVSIGALSYGLSVKGEILKRIAILKASNLIYLERGKYHLTSSGEIILNNVAVQSPKSFTKSDSNKSSKASNRAEEIMLELIESSRDSTNPDRFEKAIYKAFVYLGFDSQWIGKSGNTDVFIKTSNVPELAYRVNIDAKSTYSGPVNDNQVDFDTLKEHRDKMNANYVVIVGNEFDNGRLVRRAEEHKVGLLSVDQLNELIKSHVKTPVTFDEYKKFFEQSGLMESSILRPARESMVYTGKLLRIIVDSIYERRDDEKVDVQALHWLLKGKESIKRLPTNDEIDNVLEFLSSPLVSCITKVNGGYYPNGSLSDTILKLNFYVEQLSKK